MLLNFDVAGAEWVIVAYLSNDPNMLRIVQNGLDAHAETGTLITNAPIELIQRERKLLGEMTDANRILELRQKHLPELFDPSLVRFLPRTMSIRQCGKKSNHGLNYDEQFRTFALVNEIEEREAKRIIHAYREIAYPGIPDWHRSIQKELKDNNRTLSDLFGNKCYFMENWGEDLFRQGYAYKPQGTVGRITCYAMAKAMDDDVECMRWLELLAQVHDSIIAQHPVTDFGLSHAWERMADACLRMIEHMSPEFDVNGRKFTLKVDLKVGLNKSNMIEIKAREPAALAAALESAYGKLKYDRRAA